MEHFNYYKDYINNKITRDDARRYFWNSGHSYETMLFNNRIEKLGELINKHLGIYNTLNQYPYFIKTIQNTEKVRFVDHNNAYQCFIKGKGSYFQDREMVSFNWEKDSNTNNPHWIGFCGDADDKNAQPILRAFIEWCDFYKGK